MESIESTWQFSAHEMKCTPSPRPTSERGISMFSCKISPIAHFRPHQRRFSPPQGRPTRPPRACADAGPTVRPLPTTCAAFTRTSCWPSTTLTTARIRAPRPSPLDRAAPFSGVPCRRWETRLGTGAGANARRRHRRTRDRRTRAVRLAPICKPSSARRAETCCRRVCSAPHQSASSSATCAGTAPGTPSPARPGRSSSRLRAR